MASTPLSTSRRHQRSAAGWPPRSQLPNAPRISMANGGAESMLLGLPLELLTEVTELVKEETLPVLRLTCKTLESVVKDRFAGCFLSFRQFCIYDEARWSLLSNLSFSRLARHLDVIRFTSETLEGKSYHQIELAQEEWRIGNVVGARRAAFRSLHNNIRGLAKDSSGPTAALIRQTLLDLQKFAPHVSVELSFHKPLELDDSHSETGLSDCSDSGPYLDDTVRQDVMFAAVLAGIRISTLKFDASFTHVFTQLSAFFKRELVASLSSTQLFSYRQSPLNTDEWRSNKSCFNAIRSVMGSLNGPHLQTLWLTDVRPTTWERQITPTLAQLLCTNTFAHLVELQLEEFLCQEDDLSRSLTQCGSNLKRLMLGEVFVVGSEHPWLAILRLLPSMTNLQSLGCKHLQTGEYQNPLNVSFADLRSPDSPYFHYCLHWYTKEDEGTITEVVGKLLSSPLSYIR